jgi:hypothetical protein
VDLFSNPEAQSEACASVSAILHTFKGYIMFKGSITMEDTSISWDIDDALTAHYTVTCGDVTEAFSVPQAKFLKALAIAVHNDGMPDYREDYEEANALMGQIRWIP